MALIEILIENGISPTPLNIEMAKRLFSHWDLLVELRSYCIENLDTGTPRMDRAIDVEGALFDLFLGSSNPNDSEAILACSMEG